MTYTDRFTAIAAHQLAQNAYARRIAAFGLPALLAPYTLQSNPIPSQRRRSVAIRKANA